MFGLVAINLNFPVFKKDNMKTMRNCIAVSCWTALLFSVFLPRLISAETAGEGANARKGRFLSMFQIVRFANDACIGTGGKNGTCFTAPECSAKAGVNGGSCAQGFGVCCIITLTCGQSSNDNCTYFDSNAVMAGGCQATICPCNDNICQLRLDFNAFSIAGPSTASTSIANLAPKSGVVSPGGAVAVTSATQCLTDTFSVSNADGPNPPVICGINTGQHMYVESNESCNTLSFQLGASPVGITAAGTRSWSIKVTQFSCNFNNLAPQGCVQYFFGPVSSTFETFNYNNGAGLHLANQDQQVCFRRERNSCRICYSLAVGANFDVSGSMVAPLNTGNLCCSYGVPASASMGFDCLHIPLAVDDMPMGSPVMSNICGQVPAADFTSVCSNRTPFSVNFRSDNWEVVPEAGQLNKGFRITYTMDAAGCNPTNTG